MSSDATRTRSQCSLAWVLAGLAGILLLRRPDAVLHPQFWAEDFVFLITAEQHGIASLGLPQAGYLHLLPRIIALAATPWDPALQPALFVLIALGVTFGVCGSILSPRLELPLRMPLALAMVAVPHTGEVFFNPTNLQWIVALGILGTGLKRDPQTVTEWCVDLGFLLVGGLTGPMILFAVPTLMLRAWHRRTRASTTVLIVGTTAAAVQLSFALGLEPVSTTPFRGFDLVATVAYHLFYSPFLGFLATPETPKIAALLAAALIAGHVGVAIATSGRYRPALLSILAFAILLLAATTLKKRIDDWEYGPVPLGDRYFYIPKTLLLWLLILGATATSRRWVRYGALLLLALVAISSLPRFRFAPHQDFGWYAACAEIRAGKDIVVAIDPGWKFLYQRGSAESRLLSRREAEELKRR